MEGVTVVVEVINALEVGREDGLIVEGDGVGAGPASYAKISLYMYYGNICPF